MKSSINQLILKLGLMLMVFAWSPAFVNSANAQALDSKGTDFWLTFPGNLSSPVASLFISGTEATSGTVTIPGTGFSAPFTVAVGAITTVALPSSVFLNSSNVIGNNGIHVTAQKEVTIYGLNREQFTTDAYLGLPTDILGTEYINLGYQNVDVVNATQFGIVATQNATTVTITPTVTTSGRLAAVPFNITLNQGQTYLLRNTGSFPSDLSGTIIMSDKPIAVFGSHQCANIPRGFFACDHVVEELPSTASWGKNFITVPLKTRLKGDTFRFLASQNATTVQVNGATVATLNRGQFFETVLTTASQVISDKPILVAQYSNSSSFDDVTSDPFMMLIPPFEQFLGAYTITTPASGFSQNFVNVVAPNAAVGTIMLDGAIIPAGSFTPVGSTGFSGAQLNISLGAHNLSGGGLPFGVFVYGFDSFDSYGYPGGQSLSPVATVSSITLTPETGSGAVGTNQCWNALVKDQFNNPVTGVRVDFNITGVHPGSSGFATTNTMGIAQFCFTGTTAGPDNIKASVGTLSDVSTFTWTAGGCTIVSSVTINNQPSGGMSNGSVTINASGGTAPYTFTVNGVSNNTGMFDGLAAGTYSYSVKDTGCTVNGTFTLTQITTPPPPPPVNVSGNCPRDTIIMADPTTCMAKVGWSVPSLMYPDTLNVPAGMNGAMGKLIFKGMYNGHGYYESSDWYLWTESRDISMGLGGHLVTITTPEENQFIFNNLRQPIDSWGAWIGLYNTGTPGSFAWVTGEPVGFTNWNRNEPNNQGGSATVIAEPYVHILGYDVLNRWNDIRNRYQNFIAEFDAPLLTYRQISGPDNGSMVQPGTYMVCYERTNTMTNTKDTCCFTVRVVCNPKPSPCPKDTVIMADPITCMATVDWTAPANTFLDTLNTYHGLVGGLGKLVLKGVYNGHAYYQSTDEYLWTQSRDIATTLGGHLVTITSAEENMFIYNNLRQPDNTWGPWIGLYNTGTVGSFAWVTGEPVSYTNWNVGEPNNQGGSATFIAEPYVHIMGFDPLDRWNDVHARYQPFIAEFENAAFTFRQISGPLKGSQQPAGVYTICYERTNTMNQMKDTCCFTVTVLCNNTTSITVSERRVNTEPVNSNTLKGFKVIASPNPTTTVFTLRIDTDNNTEKVNVRVVDIYGKVLELRNGIAPNSIIRFGGNYRPGVYFTQVMQGDRKLVMRLIKE
jgi:hypothetical protein